jgi:hypothetical protein
MRTQPTADTCLIYLGSSVHKLRAYPKESDSPSLSDHWSADDMLSCGSDASPRKHAALLGASNELGTSVRNDGLWHNMQAQDARNIQLGMLLSPIEGVHRNEMSRLGKSVDDYPNGVKLVAGERWSHNEIHTDVFLFPGRNTQRL